MFFCGVVCVVVVCVAVSVVVACVLVIVVCVVVVVVVFVAILQQINCNNYSSIEGVGLFIFYFDSIL